MQIDKIQQWKQTRKGLAITGSAELLLVYLISSRAIHTGSLWQYALAFVFLIGALRNLIRAIFYHDKQQ